MRIYTINLKCLYICHMFIEFYLLYLPAEVAASRVQTFTSKKLDVNAHFEKYLDLYSFNSARQDQSGQPSRTKSGHAAVLGRARGSQQAAAPEDEKVQEVALRKETKTSFNKSSETGVGNAAEKGIKSTTSQ